MSEERAIAIELKHEQNPQQGSVDMRNVTRWKQSQDYVYSIPHDGTLNDIAVELQRLSREKDILIGITAHEIRNHLSVIRLCADMLRDGVSWKLSESERQLLFVIGRSSVVMTRVVGDLQDIPSVEAGRISIDVRNEEFVSVVNNSIAFSRVLAEQRDIILDFSSDIFELNVKLDRIRIEQVFNNLIHNAIKYSPQNSKVRITIKLDSHTIVTAVEDQGAGLSEHETGDLFKSLDQYGGYHPTAGHGAGLGLIIAGTIVRAHGGTIWARSEVGKGSTFYVSLPVL